MRLLKWLAAVTALLAGLPGAVGAETGEPPKEASEPWHIAADRIQYHQELDLYEAQGNVTVTRQGRKLTADTVVLNQKTQDALAEGNVRLISGEDTLSASRLELNLNTETGLLTNGSLFFSENHLYLSGDHIRKTGPQTFSADRITITACDGPDPDWRITGKDLNVTLEGYGLAKHAALWAGKVPILYTPYLVFPVKLRRQSGFLMPELGYSTRKGGHFLLPFFWAINDSSDATLYGQYMSERGLRTGMEYRYVLSQMSMGTLMADGFNDLKVDDGAGDSSKKWGYDDDEALRTNTDRYWVRMKSDQELWLGFDAKLDIDIVSDQDYLSEFKSGFNGFDKTRDYFIGTYGRTLDASDDPIRMNQFTLSRVWKRYSFNTNMLWYDDVVKRRNNVTDQTLQRWPLVSFNGIKQPLADSPLRFDLATSYVHFYRIHGTRGQRIDLYPRLYLPFQLANAISIEPSAGLRHTAWRTYEDETTGTTDPDDDTFFRNLYDLKLNLNTELFRVYEPGPAGSNRFQHSIKPQIIYAFVPDEDQSDLPKFDRTDRIERENLITYGVTNLFTARYDSSTKDAPTDHRYIQFLRFRLEQSFDINKHNEDHPEPFSPITAELDLTPGRYVSIDSDAQWSTYGRKLKSVNAALILWDNRQDRLSIDYRNSKEYTRDALDPDGILVDKEIESVRLNAVFNINEHWRMSGAHERNLLESEDIETLFGIGYRTQCWGIDVEYSIENGNQSYTAMFNLLGLGSFGN
jgi:LPS-assembly protein